MGNHYDYWDDTKSNFTLEHRLDYLGSAIIRFVRESNRIEGIEETTSAHYSVHYEFLRKPDITIDSLIRFVSIVQPDARLRDNPSVPGVRVGRHIAPPSSPEIRTDLESILTIENVWEQHCRYLTLHPFTDGNGRSARAIWLHRHFHDYALDQYAIERGFLHSFYYQTLSNADGR